jgi:hypothetical protein
MGQFTQYNSTDSSGPGPLTGQIGSLLTVLDACLVNGYSGKTAAGWTKPYANSSDSGCYQQGAGTGSPTQFCIAINDDAYNSHANEYYGAGFTALTSVNSGTGQFPTPSQGGAQGGLGYLVGRKSATADSTARQWTLFADGRTFYLFTLTGDTSTNYFDFGFGDFYSLAGSSDANRCMIIGRNAINTATQSTIYGGLDRQVTPYATSNQIGCYMANSQAGTSGSVAAFTFGDVGKGTTSGALTGTFSALAGMMPTPNPYDNSYYMCPVLITDSSWGIRGQLRGIYHVCHPTSSFSNGMTFSGANDYAGKSFTIICPGQAGGIYCIETSNTVNTN